MLKIEKNVDNGKATICLEGRLDTVTAPELEKETKEIIEDLKELVFDFTGVEYVSSAGLRILLSAQKVMNAQGEMKVRHVNETVKEIFDVTGFSDILTIE